MIEFGSVLANLNKKLDVFSKSVLELLENFVKTESNATSIAHETKEQRQKI